MKFSPVGRIRSAYTRPEDLHFACREGLLAKTVSEIMVDENLSGALDGLSGFSHAWILFNLHRADKTHLRTIPAPPGIKVDREVGVFSCRSQYRPNKIGLRLVEILGVKGNVLRVRGLDAIDGSPVIDIKPYFRQFDRPQENRQPEWSEW